MPRKTIGELPNEVLLAVFANVEFSKENWNALRLTCRLFNCVMTEHSTPLIIDIGHRQFRTAALLRQAAPKTRRWLQDLHSSTHTVDLIAHYCGNVEDLIPETSQTCSRGCWLRQIVKLGLHLVQFLGDKQDEEFVKCLGALKDECCLLMACASTVVASLAGNVIANYNASILLVNPAGDRALIFLNEALHKTIRVRMMSGELDLVANFLLAHLVLDQSVEGLANRAELNKWMRRGLQAACLEGLMSYAVVPSWLKNCRRFEERLEKIGVKRVNRIKQGLECMRMVSAWSIGTTNLGETLCGMII